MLTFCDKTVQRKIIMWTKLILYHFQEGTKSKFSKKNWDGELASQGESMVFSPWNMFHSKKDKHWKRTKRANIYWCEHIVFLFLVVQNNCLAAAVRNFFSFSDVEHLCLFLLIIHLFKASIYVPGVRSMGPVLSNWLSIPFCKLNWCDSSWWRYKLNTNW